MEGLTVEGNKLKFEMVEDKVTNFECGKSFEMSEGKAESDFSKLVNPFKIQEIVENVLKYCSQKDILNCRQVSKSWNNAAVRILTKLPDLHLQCHDLEELSKRKEGKTLQEFQTLLNESKTPQVLFKNIRITGEIPFRCVKILRASAAGITLRKSQRQKLLQQFGTHVKILTVDEDYGLSFMKNCLGPNGYFPNLEVLKVLIVDVRKNRDSKVGFPPLDEVGALRLKELYFHDLWKLDRRKCSEMLLVLKSILEKCPEVHTLHLKTNWQRTHLYVESLRSAPLITKKLKELYISGIISDSWKQLSQIEFSEKLKVIQFHDCSDGEYSHSMEEIKKDVKTFLGRVSQSLESLELRDKGEVTWVDVRIIPFMPKLKKLILEQGHYRRRSWLRYQADRYSDFLINVPLLRELHITEILDFYKFVERYLEEGQSVVAGSSNYVPKFAHQHLEKINLSGYNDGLEDLQLNIYSPTTIKILNAVFPKFSELEIKLNPPVGPWIEGEQFWFEELFSAISKMKNLKVLKIQLGSSKKCNEVYHGIVDLKQALTYLKETPSLEEFTLRGFNIKDRQIRWLEHLQALKNAPKLRRICVISSPLVMDENVTIGLRRIVNEFAEKNITVRGLSFL